VEIHQAAAFEPIYVRRRPAAELIGGEGTST
jgi:hypothetical protein